MFRPRHEMAMGIIGAPVCPSVRNPCESNSPKPLVSIFMEKVLFYAKRAQLLDILKATYSVIETYTSSLF